MDHFKIKIHRPLKLYLQITKVPLTLKMAGRPLCLKTTLSYKKLSLPVPRSHESVAPTLALLSLLSVFGASCGCHWWCQTETLTKKQPTVFLPQGIKLRVGVCKCLTKRLHSNWEQGFVKVTSLWRPNKTQTTATVTTCFPLITY